MLKVIEAFAGVGSQRMALRNLGIKHEVVGIFEIDKFALKSYEAIHGECPNLGDISKIDVKDIPRHDLFTYSFPCQDLSVAGKQKGMIRGVTRSGLLYECERIIKYCKPKYLLLENVKNLVGKKNKPQFNEWLKFLEDLGYKNYWKVLNAKDYGVPQNRERVFVVSILGEHKPYNFPLPVKLDKSIKDILEDEVEEKYYMNKPFHLVNKKNEAAELQIKAHRSIKSVQSPNHICPTLTTMQGGHREPKILQVAKTECRFDQESRVYGVNGISPTLAARDSQGPKKILCVGNTNPSGRGINGNVFDSKGLSPTLTTNKGEGIKILISQATKKGYIEMEVPGVCDLSYPNSKTRRGRVQENGKISPTLTASTQDICYITYKGEDIELPCICASRGRNPINPSSRIAGLPTKQFLEINKNRTSNTITTVQKDNYAIEKNYRVRKLTPLECWRLMAFTDEDFFKAKNAGISNSQLYKQAGNSIVVKVLEGIFKELFLSEKEANERDFEIVKLGNTKVEQFKWVI